MTASSIRGRVQAKAISTLRPATSPARASRRSVAGAAVSTSPGQRVALGDWGYAIVLAQGSAPTTGSFRGNVTALEIGVTVDHGGLPAGTQILVGYAEVAVTSPTPAPTTTSTQPTPKPTRGRRASRRSRRNRACCLADRPAAAGRLRPKLTPSLRLPGLRRVVVHEHVRRAARADHVAPRRGHLRAARRTAARRHGRCRVLGRLERRRRLPPLAPRPAGEPVLLRAPVRVLAARAERRARAGDVLGFMGNSGDAQGTPYHLHFEIHPVGLLSYGYDGVVSPYPYLIAWRRLSDIVFPDGSGGRRCRTPRRPHRSPARSCSRCPTSRPRAASVARSRARSSRPSRPRATERSRAPSRRRRSRTARAKGTFGSRRLGRGRVSRSGCCCPDT